MKKLKNPHLKLNNPINVIGSDGKYSTLLSLKTFLEAEGHKTTSFISPHLYKMETRISLKDKYISLKDIKKYERSIKLLPRRDEIAPPLMITINKVKLSNMPAIKSRS